MPFGMGARYAQIPMESASTAIVASAAVIRADSAAAVAAASQNEAATVAAEKTAVLTGIAASAVGS